MEPSGSKQASRGWILVPIVFGLTLVILLLAFLLKSREAKPDFIISSATAAEAPAETAHTEQSHCAPSSSSTAAGTTTRRQTTKRTTAMTAAATAKKSKTSAAARTTAASRTEDNRAAYEAEAARINAIYEQAEKAYHDRRSELTIKKEIELEILKKQYIAMQQLHSGAYQAARREIITRYQKLEEENEAGLEQAEKERTDALSLLKHTYKIPE